MHAGLTEMVQTYLRSEFGRAPAVDEPLLGAGLLDSLRFVLFMSHVEEQLGVRIPEADMTEENFRDVRSTVAYLATLPGADRFATAGATEAER